MVSSRRRTGKYFFRRLREVEAEVKKNWKGVHDDDHEAKPAQKIWQLFHPYFRKGALRRSGDEDGGEAYGDWE